MARKTPKGKPKMPATEEKLRAVRLELSEEEHAGLRVEAARQDVSLMHLARVAVREYLARHSSKARPKGGE